MYWLRKRLGGAGWPCLRIREYIRESLPEIQKAGDSPLGFSSSELAAFSAGHHLPEIAKHFAWRGPVAWLEKIAWWGSAIGDIASVQRPTERSRILWEAAAFNLGAALFDSILEQAPGNFPPLAQALDCTLLAARLECPAANHSALACNDSSLNLIVQLFDSTLSSAGQRFSDRPAQIKYLAELVETMYQSEVGLSPDRFAAKTLPLVFIGALGNPDQAPDAHHLFHFLGRFVLLWDDWLDMAEDVFSFAPNAFLGAPRSPIQFDTLLYSIRFLLRVAGGTLFHKKIACALSKALIESLAAAQHWDEEAYRKTLLLGRELLQ